MEQTRRGEKEESLGLYALQFKSNQDVLRFACIMYVAYKMPANKLC